MEEDAGCRFSDDGGEVVYRFQPAVAGIFCLNTAESSYDTLLYVREICDDPETEISCDDDSGEGNAAELELDLFPGDIVYVFVDAYSSRISGDYRLEIAEGACP